MPAPNAIFVPSHVYRMNDDVIAIEFKSERVTADIARQILADLHPLLASQKKPRFAFFDCSLVRSYSSDIPRPAGEVLSAVKNSGAKEVVAAIQSSAVSMIASSLTFVAGFRLKAFRTSKECIEYMQYAAKN